jgi:hypothetical protein
MKRADCLDYYKRNNSISGVYIIYPYEDDSRQLKVYCDMETSGGGWTVSDYVL